MSLPNKMSWVVLTSRGGRIVHRAKFESIVLAIDSPQPE